MQRPPSSVSKEGDVGGLHSSCYSFLSTVAGELHELVPLVFSLLDSGLNLLRGPVIGCF